ncbi:MAG: hypothetical protein N4A61_02875 [Pelagimonas sp.]|jgi:hypothetical protein|nr:hypothetical protein [Pelagimonas sp.]
MQFSGLSLLWAPLTTGHRDGLPEVPNEDDKSVQKVAAAQEARNPELQLDSGSAQPTDFWRVANGDPDPNSHNAPPSIMQIKITQILKEQEDLIRALSNPSDASQSLAPLDRIKAAIAETDPILREEALENSQSPALPHSDESDARSSVLSTLP